MGVYAGALPVAARAGFRADESDAAARSPTSMLLSLWLGNRTQTAAHWDCRRISPVGRERRTFTAASAQSVANLYVGPIDRTLAGQPSSLVDSSADLGRFPIRRSGGAGEIARSTGDALYRQPVVARRAGWTIGAMLNYWWRDGPARHATRSHPASRRD